jgi:hypothetical protein
METVKISRFDVTRKFNHDSYREKGWESLGTVEICYHGLNIKCNLIKGKSKDHLKEAFYFIELPCARFRSRGKWVKNNFLHFPSQEESNLFQELALRIMGENHPQLFDEKFLEKRKANKQLTESERPLIKARNKSKFT